MEEPPKKFFRLSPGNEVRLRYAYIIKCERVVKDAAGEIVGAALHHRSRVAARSDGRRARERHDSLGVGRARGRCRGAPVRPAVSVGRPGRRRPRSADRSQSELARDRSTRVKVEPALASAAAGSALPIRAAGLLLRRSRLDAGHAGLQPHGHAEGHLGEDQRQGSITSGHAFGASRSCIATSIASGS